MPEQLTIPHDALGRRVRAQVQPDFAIEAAILAEEIPLRGLKIPRRP